MRNPLTVVNIVFKKAMARIVSLFFCNNKKYFYAEYHGTLTPAANVIRNIFNPERIWTKGRYGQLKVFPSPLVKTEPVSKHKDMPGDFNSLLTKYSEDFKRDGVVILPNYLAREVNQLHERYRLDKKYCELNVTYLAKRFDLRHDDLIAKLVLDPMILLIMSNKFGCQPVIRTQPTIWASNPEVSFEEFFAQRFEMLKKDMGKGNMRWHYDTANMISCHILLEDAAINTTHMLVAKKTAHQHHMHIDDKFDYFFSDEYVRDHCEIVPCIGGRGTVILFDNNALHRMNPIKNTYRCLITTLYTPGNAVYWWRPKRTEPPNPGRLLELKDEVKDIPVPDINQLTDLQLAAFRWFPKTEEDAEKFVNKSTYAD